MIEAKAVVLKVEAGRIWVKVSDRQDGCGRCDEPGGCRSVKIAYALKPPAEVFSLPDTIGARPGDRVLVRMEDGVALAGALASYGLGAILLLAGAGAGHMIAGDGNPDFHAMAGAALGMFVAVLVNRLMHRSGRWRGSLKMDIVRDDESCTMQARVAQ